MRDAETVLNVIRDRGKRGLPLEDIYRQLYNRELYLRAYGRLYSNQGAMTRGTTADTVDGMSLAKIDRLIDALRYERFRWTPGRRVNIPKPNGKTRPLGIPTWTDKLLQEVIRMILEAYYEPQFSDRSHGFRPLRGCHTALSEVAPHLDGNSLVRRGRYQGVLRQYRPRGLAVGTRRKASRQPLPTPAQASAESGIHGRLALWPHPERYTARRSGQSHIGKHLPGPVGPVCREIPHPSQHPWHSPKNQPSVERVEGPHGNPAEKGEIPDGSATPKADATTAVIRPPRPWLPAAPIRPIRRRLRAGLHRAKSRSRADQGILGNVPARYSQAGIIQGKDPDNPRHQPGGQVPRPTNS